MKKQHDTLVILASHPETRKEFDWKRVNEVDIFAFNEAVSRGEWVLHASAVFQMHIPAIWRNPANRNDNKHAEWLVGGQTPPVIMQARYEDVPMSEPYPLDGVITTLLSNFSRPPSKMWNNKNGVFGSSIDYALALGIYLEYKRIEIYGCEMALNTEYMYQRPTFCFWVGLAAGRGIAVDYHGQIFDIPLYGYEGDIYLPKKLFTDRLEEVKRLGEEAIIQYKAMKQELYDNVMNMAEGKIDPKDVAVLMQKVIVSAQRYTGCDGIRQENERYLGKIETMLGAADDFRISRTEFEQSKGALSVKLGQLSQTSYILSKEVDDLFIKIQKANGYRKRKKAIGIFWTGFEKFIHAIGLQFLYESAIKENMRYMGILDQLYRAAGGSKSVEVLEKQNNVNAE